MRIVKKKLVLGAYEANGDWKSLAKSLNVPKTTVYRWVKKGDMLDERGGSRGKKILDVHRNFCIEAIEFNVRITLFTLKSLLKSKFDLDISTESIRTLLDGVCYSLKKLRFEPERGNSEENKEKRRDYAVSLLHFQSLGLPIIYMDETNFNIHISRSEGRSKKGTRANVVVAGSRGANVHIIGCIGVLGLVYSEVRRGSFKKENALEWVRECLRRAREMFNGPVVLVIDNAPCHSHIEDVLNEEEFNENHILRLGPYSPMLNPIENAWSVFKADVKRQMAEQMQQILSGEGQGTLTTTEFRLQKLENAILSSLSTITPSLCNNVIAKIQGILPSVLNREDVIY